MSAEAVKSEFVTREVFDAYIQSINSRVKANEELDDMRMERTQAIIDKNMSDINGAISLLAERMQQGFNLMNERIQRIEDSTAQNHSLMNEHIQRLEGSTLQNFNIMNERIKRFEESAEQNLNLMNERTNNTNERINRLENDVSSIKSDISTMQEKFSDMHSDIKTLALAVSNTDRRFTDFKEEQSKSLAKWAVAATLFIGAIQAVISIVLYFWK